MTMFVGKGQAADDPLGAPTGLQDADTGVNTTNAAGEVDTGGNPTSTTNAQGDVVIGRGRAPSGKPWLINAQNGTFVVKQNTKDGSYWMQDIDGNMFEVQGAASASGTGRLTGRNIAVNKNTLGVYNPTTGTYTPFGGGVATLSPGQIAVSPTAGVIGRNPIYDPTQYALLVQEANRQYQLQLTIAQQKWQQDRDTQAYRNAQQQAENQYRTQLLGIQRAQLGEQVAIRERELGQPQVVQLNDGRTLILRPNEMVGGISRDWQNLLGEQGAITTPDITQLSPQTIPDVAGVNAAPLTLPTPAAPPTLPTINAANAPATTTPTVEPYVPSVDESLERIGNWAAAANRAAQPGAATTADTGTQTYVPDVDESLRR